MGKLGIGSTIMKIALLTLAFGLVASAQATRTWVSGVGDDANPCSRTAPCKTFAGAISKTAAKGEINCLDPGGFGAVTITKAITIDCEGTLGSVLVSGTNGIVVSAGASDAVTLRNISIQGVGTGINGIRYLAGRTLHVENVRINAFTNSCIDANTAAASILTVQNVTMSECGAAGLSIINSAGSLTAHVGNVRIDNSTFGVKGFGGAVAHIRNSFFSANSVGVGQSAAGSILSVTSSQFAANGTGVQSLSGASIHIFGNVFGSNSTAVNPNGGSILSDSQNGMVSNGANGSVTGAVTKL